MLFNSIEYLVFFVIVGTLYFALPGRVRWVLLLGASYWFYASWNATYLVLILTSTCLDYVVGRRLVATERHTVRRRWLLASLVGNLGLLFTFKYWNFFTENLQHALGGLAVSRHIPELNVLLPVGISFYTFQTLSYTIDVYRRKIPFEPHLGRFALYVAFFPQLVAGPIERASHLLPQICRRYAFDTERIASGLQLALWGLFKKIVIADRLAIYVDAVYGDVHAHAAGTFLLATYAFAFQIYCDFSGYSDIAIGCARVLGFDLMKNFNRPYFATNIVEFWRRWHISLSTWLRDYLYIPLGGNRRGVSRTYVNLLITMVLGGLWHGASWNFVVWGALQGVMLALTRATSGGVGRLMDALRVPVGVRRGLGIAFTFHFVCLSWVFFRADSLSDAVRILASFASRAWAPFVDVPTLAHGVVGVVILLIVQIVQERRGSVRDILASRPLVVRWVAWYALILCIVLMGVDGGSQFIYFQF